MSLKLRLSLLISLLLALLTLAGAAFALRSAREDVRAEVRSSAELAIRLLDSELRRSGAAGALPVPPFGLDALAEVRHVRIEFRHPEGHLLESNRVADRGPKFTAPEWFARLVERDAPPRPVVRRRVERGGALLGELVVLPDPSFEVDEIWGDARNLLALLGLLFLATIALVYWVVGRALEPVERILEALTQLERGNLATRLPEIELPELSRVGREFNRMMDTLQASVTRNRQLAQQLLQVQEEERRALAHELHDELGQYLTAIHADATAIARLSPEAPPRARESADAIISSVREIMGRVRGMLQRLRPEALESLGLEEAVRELVEGWQGRNPDLECRLEIAGPIGDVDDAAAIAAYRVIQEALTNVTRHSQARRVTVGLERRAGDAGDALAIKVADDGRGLPEEPQRGFGLLGMRERVEALGGSVVVGSEAGRGVAVSAVLPLRPAAAGGWNGRR
ncbi:MAG TPA: histidine kinase [Burkholderiales bacterium]|nr:histidine kinase [Burkholderiales bacterium]